MFFIPNLGVQDDGRASGEAWEDTPSGGGVKQ
jgi:hypothetical protein